MKKALSLALTLPLTVMGVSSLTQAANAADITGPGSFSIRSGVGGADFNSQGTFGSDGVVIDPSGNEDIGSVSGGFSGFGGATGTLLKHEISLDGTSTAPSLPIENYFKFDANDSITLTQLTSPVDITFDPAFGGSISLSYSFKGQTAGNTTLPVEGIFTSQFTGFTGVNDFKNALAAGDVTPQSFSASFSAVPGPAALPGTIIGGAMLMKFRKSKKNQAEAE